MRKSFEIDFNMVGRRMRNARHLLKLTQERAAERADITGQYWSLLETGRERGSVYTYLRIATALDLTLDDLFYDDAAVMRIRRAFSKDGLLADCTAVEKAIIGEMVLSLKSILERARRL